jgi:GNAT superfamily N-acetyltransferase
MSPAHLLDTLADAELQFAHFNAHRTSASAQADIRLDSNGHFRWITDASRPGHPYYNRAVSARAGDLPPQAVGQLPPAVAAVELRPSEIHAQTADALLAAGFRPGGALCYLALPAPPRRVEVPPHVHRLGEAEADVFLDLLASAGTPFPPERRAAKRHHYCTAAFPAFVAVDATGEALGWGTLFLAGRVAFLGNAFTRPEARGRGVHAALLAARLNAAADAGAEHVFTDVEHGSQSHANCERAGLRTVTINVVWERVAAS